MDGRGGKRRCRHAYKSETNSYRHATQRFEFESNQNEEKGYKALFPPTITTHSPSLTPPTTPTHHHHASCASSHSALIHASRIIHHASCMRAKRSMMASGSVSPVLYFSYLIFFRYISHSLTLS